MTQVASTFQELVLDTELINFLINSEFQLASYMGEIGLRLAAPNVAFLGFSAFFCKKAEHIYEKAMKAVFHFQLIGGVFTKAMIEPLNTEMGPVTGLESVIQLETETLRNLRARSVNIKDLAMQSLLSEKIKDMMEHLGVQRTLLTRLLRVADSPVGLSMLDNELLLIEAHHKHHKKYHHHEYKHKHHEYGHGHHEEM